MFYRKNAPEYWELIDKWYPRCDGSFRKAGHGILARHEIAVASFDDDEYCVVEQLLAERYIQMEELEVVENIIL